jgi:predicted transcriptional regulator
LRKSKLESYENILEALMNEPLTLEHIKHVVDLDSALLTQHLTFLMKNDLIEERLAGKKALYAITERGAAVFRALNFQKYLGRIKNTIRAIDEALQVIPTISQECKPEEKNED